MTDLGCWVRHDQVHTNVCVCVLVVEGDGRLGYPDLAPYDAIHVGAAAPTVPQPVRHY